MKDLLIVDDDALCRELLEKLASQLDRSYVSLDCGAEALKVLDREKFKVVLTDVRIGGADGCTILKHTKRVSPDTEVIVLTAFGGVEQAVECIKNGAYDYITKPYLPEDLMASLRRAFEKHALVEQTRVLKSQIERRFRVTKIIGESKAMTDVLELVKLAAQCESTVLITGETGTGKGLIAEAIHGEIARKERPFVTVHCPGIPEGLIESELFGHEKGAFTSAVSRRIGKFEEARDGTIFLDEIAELNPHTQTKLLQVLQDRVFERIGSNQHIRVNARVISATNQNLEDLMAKGRFRDDLYWRLNVLHIHVPPLRERKEDIPLFVEDSLKAKRHDVFNLADLVCPTAMEAMLEYHWPGNVRELQNALERARVLCGGGRIKLHHLSPKLRVSTSANCLKPGGSLDEVIKSAIEAALEKHHWNKTRAASELKIERTSLIRKIHKYGLRKPEGR